MTTQLSTSTTTASGHKENLAILSYESYGCTFMILDILIYKMYRYRENFYLIKPLWPGESCLNMEVASLERLLKVNGVDSLDKWHQ